MTTETYQLRKNGKVIETRKINMVKIRKEDPDEIEGILLSKFEKLPDSVFEYGIGTSGTNIGIEVWTDSRCDTKDIWELVRIIPV